MVHLVVSCSGLRPAADLLVCAPALLGRCLIYCASPGLLQALPRHQVKYIKAGSGELVSSTACVRVCREVGWRFESINMDVHYQGAQGIEALNNPHFKKGTAWALLAVATRI